MSARLLALRAMIGGAVNGDSGVFPGPGHHRKDRSLSIRDLGSRVVVHSFSGDDLHAIFAYLSANGIDVPAKPQPLTAQERMRFREMRVREEMERKALERQRKLIASQLWRSAIPASGPVLKYLRGRSIGRAALAQAVVAGDLRYLERCPRAPYQADTRFAPAMLGLVRDRWGGCLGLHITFIAADGSGKAFGDRSRLMVAAQSGGAIRLATAGEVLAVAEGIETALSFATLHGLPTWAARSTNGLERFHPPEGVKELIIASDADDAGRKASAQLYERMRLSHHVRLATPPEGMDWNDVLVKNG